MIRQNYGTKLLKQAKRHVCRAGTACISLYRQTKQASRFLLVMPVFTSTDMKFIQILNFNAKFGNFSNIMSTKKCLKLTLIEEKVSR